MKALLSLVPYDRYIADEQQQRGERHTKAVDHSLAKPNARPIRFHQPYTQNHHGGSLATPGPKTDVVHNDRGRQYPERDSGPPVHIAFDMRYLAGLAIIRGFRGARFQGVLVKLETERDHAYQYPSHQHGAQDGADYGGIDEYDPNPPPEPRKPQFGGLHRRLHGELPYRHTVAIACHGVPSQQQPQARPGSARVSHSTIPSPDAPEPANRELRRVGRQPADASPDCARYG